LNRKEAETQRFFLVLEPCGLKLHLLPISAMEHLNNSPAHRILFHELTFAANSTDVFLISTILKEFCANVKLLMSIKAYYCSTFQMLLDRIKIK